MRVTNQMIANNIINNIQNNLSTVTRTQQELSTSKTMLQLSDEPQNLSRLLSVNSTISYMEQYNSNLDDGLSYLNLSDSTMQSVGDLLNTASSLAVQGSNGTYTADDLNAMAEQVDKMIDQTVDLANTSLGGRYIFAGTNNTSAPFQRNGDKITYTGDTNGLYRQVMSGDSYRIDQPGVTTGSEVDTVTSTSGVVPKVLSRQTDLSQTGIVTITCTAPGTYTITNPTTLDGVTPAPALVPSYSTAGNVVTVGGAGGLQGLQIDMTGTNVGDQYKVVINNQVGVFGHATETSPGTYTVYDPTSPNASADQGIFDVLFGLRDDLKSGDSSAINADIDKVHTQLDQLLARRTAIGSRTNHFKALQSQYDELGTSLADAQNKLEGADMYKLTINLSQQQVTYEASLQSTSSIMQVTLLNYLK